MVRLHMKLIRFTSQFNQIDKIAIVTIIKTQQKFMSEYELPQRRN